MEKKTNMKGVFGIFAFSVTCMCNNITMGILAYIMATYSEVSPTNVALLLTWPAVVGTVFAFAAGSLINKLGAKKVAIGVHFMLFLTGMIYLFFGNKTNIAVLYVAAALSGFLMGSMGTITGQLFVETIPDESKRASYIGYNSSIMSIGGVIFATLGGIIAAKDNGAHWEKAYVLFFAILISIILEIILLPDSKKKSVAQGAAAPAPGEAPPAAPVGKMPAKVWAISIHYMFFFLFLYAFGLNCSEFIITTYKLGTSVESGLATSMVTVGGVVAGFAFGSVYKILKKWHFTVMVGLAAAGLAIACFFNSSIIPVYVAAALMGFAMTGAMPFIMMELSRIAPGPLYPKAMSIYSGFMNAGMMIAVYALAFLSKLFCGDPNSVPGKMMVGFIGCVICAITSIPIYCGKEKKTEEVKSV